MKKILMAAVVAVVALAGCTKDNSNNGEQTIIVSLPADAITKAVEAEVTGSVATDIVYVRVYLMNGTSVVATDIFDAAELSSRIKHFEQVSSSINNVVVLVNVPSADQTTVAALGNYNAIKNFAFDIAGQNVTGTPIPINGKTMMGEAAPVVTTPNPGAPTDTHVYKLATITLYPITARLEIGAVKAGVGITNIELVSVWVNNYIPTHAGAASTAVLNPMASPYWVTDVPTGERNTVYAAVTTPAYVPTVYKNLASAAVNTLGSNPVSAYAFHVYPGNVPHIVMLVKGTYATGYYEDDKAFFLKYVTFDKFDQSGTSTPDWVTALTANKIYKVGVGTVGITIDAKDLEDKPETDKIDLGVKVQVANWQIVSVTPGVQ